MNDYEIDPTDVEYLLSDPTPKVIIGTDPNAPETWYTGYDDSALADDDEGEFVPLDEEFLLASFDTDEEREAFVAVMVAAMARNDGADEVAISREEFLAELARSAV